MMKRTLIVVMVAVILCGIFADNSDAGDAKASFSYRSNLIKDSQLLVFTFEPNLKKRGWAVVDELQKIGWKEKEFGNFVYSTDQSPDVKEIRMEKVKGVLRIQVNRNWMVLSLQSTTGSMATPKEIAARINELFLY